MAENHPPVAGRPDSRPRRASLALAVWLALLAGGGVRSETGGVRPYRLPPDLRAYFKARYERIDSVQSSIEATPDGPLGELRVSGSMVPRVVGGGTTPEERARAVANAFLDQEAALLDIPDPAEYREAAFDLNHEGQATVQYFRYINGMPLLGLYVTLQVGPDGAIRRASAALFPVSNDVYRATRRTALSREEVIRIIEQDLRTPGSELVPRVGDTRQVASWRSPHVLWQAHGSKGGRKPSFVYTLDAFSGRILTKGCDVESLVPQTPGSTLCD